MAKTLQDLSVLIVDDSPPAVRLLEAVLGEIGVETVHTAADGVEAEEFLDGEGGMVDLILCDWRMPRMSGIELLKKVRVTRPDVLFVMLTGTKDEESIATAREEGVNAFVGKPYSPTEIEEKLAVLASQL